MLKLSENVATLLAWLREGHTVCVCTHAGRSLGDVQTTATAPVKSVKPALDTLIQYGLVKETEFHDFGIRWSCFEALQDGDV
jgi:hypothetical protein